MLHWNLDCNVKSEMVCYNLERQTEVHIDLKWFIYDWSIALYPRFGASRSMISIKKYISDLIVSSVDCFTLRVYFLADFGLEGGVNFIVYIGSCACLAFFVPKNETSSHGF